ncbi:hypothetical protein BMS3Bbin11_01276 [bacterium BMS3Bbin11]|nr:hypothetical protein BMS3Bbin11_01276 [bacterium BMS3Bbin11]GMT40703.1 MAG: hypothetical protein IEMM0001_1438 [bacterium]
MAGKLKSITGIFSAKTVFLYEAMKFFKGA